ncbi:DUF3081 domain-containing protein [Paraglaciecola hydrolytica]|uniref:DUF3081 domain-containing protein n=1 Tax=Paraglaciecola hydrolytica TaxID=1799789 RepID=A0A135ZZG0_9ALTE|nr:DUF3081 domain-containing protein [Paraglaciecola hydrolytica]KXI28372.1 hypothetical protein AX660_18585 [Paraglaciecola hydrolytica]
MKNEIDSKFILQVFEIIRLHGEKKGENYFLQGIEASSDFDGYTLFLQDAQVQLSFGFHNQYHLDYLKEEHLEQFIDKLKAIKSRK